MMEKTIGRSSRVLGFMLLLGAALRPMVTAASAEEEQQASQGAQPGEKASGLTPPTPRPAPEVTDLGNVTVVGRLNEARSQIAPELGATTFTVDETQLANQPQGSNAPFSQALERAPGVAPDSLGRLHLRGECMNAQYRVNGVLLPEGLTGFGGELDLRFIDSFRLITGSLPAQYGFRVAGIIDIQTKSGAFAQGGELGVLGGSYETLRPNLEYGGSRGSFNYFVGGSFHRSDIGIESPTSGATPIHDTTKQYKSFLYLSKVLDDSSRISFIASASYGTFQIPNTSDLPPGTTPDGSQPWGDSMSPPVSALPSARLSEDQSEGNYYGVLSYQKTTGKLDYQVAGFWRYSHVHFVPDSIGDLFFNGVAVDLNRELKALGAQADGSLALNDAHTIRGGLMWLGESLSANTTTTAFPVDGGGNPTGAPLPPIADDSTTRAGFYGLYLQDEWKIAPGLTLNYGLRFDWASSSMDSESQLSPRINASYEVAEGTKLHAGYSRYFTPPPLETVRSESVAKFAGTSNAADPLAANSGPPKAERSHYVDVGLTHTFAPGLQVGMDGYYKIARNQLDTGLFGASLISAAFNWREGRVYGLELTASYSNGGFSLYGNGAYSVAEGKEIVSSQFLFDSDELNDTRDHWAHMCQDQTFTASAGAAYVFEERFGETRPYLDLLFGSGLRKDLVTPSITIPDGSHVPAYWTLSLGVEQGFDLDTTHVLKARIDVVNVTDRVYQLRDGSGIGVNAAQYGMRRGVFASISMGI
jgi:outer membrane receptor protein involved in Fe transport